jgi:hypothetical protein
MTKSSFQLMVFGMAFSLLAGLTGCSQMTQSEIRALETREIDAPYDKVYDASLNAMFSMGLNICHTDKASGIMAGQNGDHIQRASAGLLWRPLFPVKKVTLMVAPKGSGSTSIRMKILVNEKPQVDPKLMTEIWQRIEKEAMLTEAFDPEAQSSDKKPEKGHS